MLWENTSGRLFWHFKIEALVGSYFTRYIRFVIMYLEILVWKMKRIKQQL